MNTDSFILYIKTGEIYTDITKDAESRFDTSNYELDRQYKKVIGLIYCTESQKIQLFNRQQRWR